MKEQFYQDSKNFRYLLECGHSKLLLQRTGNECCGNYRDHSLYGSIPQRYLFIRLIWGTYLRI